MKNNFLHIASKKWHRNVVVCILVTAASIFHNKAAVAQGTKDSVAKLSFTMNLSSMVSNGVRTVKVLANRKENKKTIVVDDIQSPLNLYLNEVKEYDPASQTGWISKTTLNNEGEGVFVLPASFYRLRDSVHEYIFIVKIVSDPKYDDAEEQITIADAKIIIEYAGEDSIKTETATLTAWKNGSYVPVPAAELKLCIKRTFSFLPFGEAGVVTDSSGVVTGELPLDLPGNANGTITIAARLEDDATYGTVEVTRDVPWAVLPRVNPVRGRTLWSPGDNAPLLLVISSVTIIVIIWGTILYLVSLLFKIKRLGKT